MTTRPISADQIESLAVGAWILGTGGGGSPYQGLLNLRRLYRQGAAVRLMDPGDLGDDDLVAVVSTMGAPLVMQERLADPAYPAKPEQAILFTLEAWDINCPQHIPQLIAVADVLPVVERLEARIRELEAMLALRNAADNPD